MRRRARSPRSTATNSSWRCVALAPRRREVVVLRHYCDMSERDVAELLGISLGAVKSLASRGIAELETLIGGRA